ncbi:MAG: 3-dehydroquinate synthase [Aeromicrobium sp.]|jgi:3-dehydroquinate synthase|uniref:3-dehydroquinate synthase n=1 Tax=Aeromicrobium sp. TaxID=1871063 RepID=UPI0026073637|nr:3-dehydroquinate synthase [Aeromicrobium sp.]MCW2790751.1 3-dehydroquinate synthase [Aeromicrobium sp.]MCW2824019.1 3-dehydroquinate synthase [Aeromicrobium sp.]
MTTRLRVPTERPYDVVIGNGVHEQLRGLVGFGLGVLRVAIIHPPSMLKQAQILRGPLVSDGLEVHLIEVPDSEQAKTADVLAFCWKVLGETGFTRSDVIVGLGGGATTDLAGFVAASWLRGVRFVNVPTTVLGMVDAAVGGKTGINTAQGKNLVGAFHEPVGVLCDLDLLTTLPAPELRSGLAEVVKCGFIADPSILDLVEAAPETISDPSSSIVAELITKGIAVKARTVAGDLHETGADGSIGREALNYGHTFGHAVERFERYTIRHGEAVSIGMVYVAEIAHRLGLIDDELLDRHRSVLEIVGLPMTYRSGIWEALSTTMRLDKKTRGDQMRFVVLEGLAAPTILAGPDESLLLDAYRAISS